MKNKKSQSEIITTVLIILLVLAAIVIVWQVVQQTLNPKKICTNETILRPVNESSLDLYYDISSILDEIHVYDQFCYFNKTVDKVYNGTWCEAQFKNIQESGSYIKNGTYLNQILYETKEVCK